MLYVISIETGIFEDVSNLSPKELAMFKVRGICYFMFYNHILFYVIDILITNKIKKNSATIY